MLIDSYKLVKVKPGYNHADDILEALEHVVCLEENGANDMLNLLVYLKGVCGCCVWEDRGDCL